MEIEVYPPPSVDVVATPGEPVEVNVVQTEVAIGISAPSVVDIEVAAPQGISVEVTPLGAPGPSGEAGPPGVGIPELVISETEPVVDNPTLWVRVDGDGDVQAVNLVTP